MSQVLSVGSLYTGCSGSDLGFTEEECHIVFANEINEAARKTYKANFGSEPMAVPLEMIPASLFTDLNLDVLIGGPPCQSFSNARSGADYRSCDGLRNVRQMHRVAMWSKPKIAICENAPTLCQPSMSHIFNFFVSGFEQAGYHVEALILNTEDYGIPQHRERLFFCCVREDLYGFGSRFHMPKGRNWRYDYSGWAEYLGIKVMDNGGPWFHSSGSRIKGFAPLNCPTTTILGSELPVIRYEQSNAKVGRILKEEREIHGVKQRHMTIDELAKLQGFPSNYEWVGNEGELRTMIGNAWSIPVAKALARECKRLIKEA